MDRASGCRREDRLLIASSQNASGFPCQPRLAANATFTNPCIVRQSLPRSATVNASPFWHTYGRSL